MIEAVMSFTIFAVVVMFAMDGIVNALKASHAAQQRADAANVAQFIIAKARADANANKIDGQGGVTTLANAGSGLAGQAASEVFSVVRTISFAAPQTTQCSPGTAFTIDVKVYQGASTSGKFLARSDSVVACPPA
jgi:hypothetical protein